MPSKMNGDPKAGDDHHIDWALHPEALIAID